jgi:hypothetical protein
MCKEKMEKLREQLNEMMSSEAYSREELLKVSQELDTFILQAVKEGKPIGEKGPLDNED